jgi:ubiquinone/menaquinone biosynthesis C-methylase UbiE
MARGGGAVSHHHPLFARFYTWFSRRMEDRGAAEHRDTLLAGLRGRVVEIGAGNGMNFLHLPPEVDELVAVEPEPYLRRQAERTASGVPTEISVVDGTAASIPAEPASFDAAVVSLVLCSVPDQQQALAEIRRVVRPGGELRFLEHVRADRGPLRHLQSVMDRSRLWPLFAAGCHTGRNTLAEIRRAGIEVTEVEHLRFPEDSVLPYPTAPHVIGRGRIRS